MFPKSEFDRPIEVLATLATARSASSEEHAALKLAVDALYFIYNTGQLELFRDYWAAAGKARPRRAEYLFSSTAEAEDWLAKQNPGSILGKVIKIGEVAYDIVRDPSKLMLVRTVEIDQLEAHSKERSPEGDS